MAYQATIAAVRKALTDVFAEVDGWFDRPPEMRCFQPRPGAWSADQILEHLTLTNQFLLVIIRRWAEKAFRKSWRGDTIPAGESDLARIEIIGERGSFTWDRPEHMEPTGVPTSYQVRTKLHRQVTESLELLKRMDGGEGAMCKVQMSVHDLGKIDLYQWLYFLAQHARRHLHQLKENDRIFGQQEK